MPEQQQPTLRLDDLYKMTSSIYGDRNSTRTKEATFSHFVEVCGMLTAHDRKKNREKFSVRDALCKALGWYFPLLSKMRVQSVEYLVFRKFPGVCPYCREAPHVESKCKLVKGTEKTVNHKEVNAIFLSSWKDRPAGLNEWQKMFKDIYPRSLNDPGRSIIGLMEELGELAESIRVFDEHPHYFLGEAADTFSYIMGIANEVALREEELEDGAEFSFEKDYLSRYPGLCIQCGSRICVCPSIPAATVGRMAKEIELQAGERIFIDDQSAFNAEGIKAAQTVFESIGGYGGIIENLPFDRGDANHALVQLCMKVALAVETSNPPLAATFRAEAVKLCDSESGAGTPRSELPVDDLLKNLRQVWRELDDDMKSIIRKSSGFTGELAELLDIVRVLIVNCCPDTEAHLKLAAERRAITEAIRRGPHANKFSVRDLPASTVDDLRRELLDNEYDIVHFSGHADESFLIFEDESNQSVEVPIGAIARLIELYPTVKCVILNACSSVKDIKTPMSSVTIGMDESIKDGAALAFSRGFYDALAAGLSIVRSYEEGVRAVELKGYNCDMIKIIK